MIKGILFDMDGTVLDTLRDIKESVNQAMIQFGLEPKDDHAVKLAVGNGAFQLIETLTPNTWSQEQKKAVFDVYQAYYERHSNRYTAPYNGILNLLKQLKKDGYRLGVVSNKFEFLVEKLNQEMFLGLFDVSIGEREGIPIKPAPDMIFKALKRLDLTHHEVIYLGDTKTDMLAAANAGIKSVGVTWGFRDQRELEAHGAHHIINEPMELLTLLKGEALSWK